MQCCDFADGGRFLPFLCGCTKKYHSQGVVSPMSESHFCLLAVVTIIIALIADALLPMQLMVLNRSVDGLIWMKRDFVPLNGCV